MALKYIFLFPKRQAKPVDIRDYTWNKREESEEKLFVVVLLLQSEKRKREIKGEEKKKVESLS
jgi:hypothetical protein